MSAQTNKQTNNKQLFRIHLKPNVTPFEAFKVYNGRVLENSIVEGTETKVFLEPPSCNIHNFYSHKVVKILNEKEQYNGYFKWVDDATSEEWKSQKVENIQIRYIENCPSLDKHWQEQNNYKPQGAQAYFGWAYPSNSVQTFDRTTTDKLFIEFLEHHQGCESNPNRDKNNAILFRIVNAEENIKTKKRDFEAEKQKFEFIEKIHTDDEIVNIYSHHLGSIPANFEVDDKRDEVLNKINELTVDGMIKQVNEWKTNYTSLINGWVANKEIAIKKHKIYVGKSPDPVFKEVTFDEGSDKLLILQLTNLMLTKESVFNEFETVRKKIQQ